MQVNFNINILKQLLVQQPDKADAITSKFPKIDEWKQDIKKPTFNQLADLANYFNIPFGYFFLKDIPVKEYPIPHYRTVNQGVFSHSEELLDTIQILEERQNWATDILKEFDKDSLDFAGSITTEISIQKAAEQIREILDVTENWAKTHNFATWYDAFKFLVTKTENAGIFVVINGVVGNNSHRVLNVSEFRGFVLFDEFAPFIFINNNDFVSSKIFTLIHEIAHILIGKSASFDYSNLQPANNIIEDFCDAVAAEFLVSTESLLFNLTKIGKDYQKLAFHYKVSKIVIIRRLYDLGKITYEEFLEDLNSLRIIKSESKKLSDKATTGDFYNTAPYRISRNFFNLLYASIKQNKILYRDAFRLSGLSPKSFDGYVEKYIT